MAFKKGESGNKSGKVKGTKNRKTLILDAFAKMVCEDGMTKFMEELQKLKGKDYVNAYMTVFEYVKPKLARTEVKGDLTVKGFSLELDS